VLAAVGVFPGTVTTPSACAASEVRVAVVVDFANAAGSPGGVSSVCVGVADRSNGAAVLAARAAQLGTPGPRFDQRTGLLCGIDGFPASECPTASSSGYWSYWLGDGSWTYAAVGPGGHRANASIVEGWRWVVGQSEGTAPPPAGSPVAAATCTTSPPPTSPPVTSAPPPPGSTQAPPFGTGATSPTQPQANATTTAPVSDSQSSSDATTVTTAGATITGAMASGVAAGTVDSKAVTVNDDGGGNSLGQLAGFVGGAAMIAMVAVGGVWFAKRRDDPGPGEQ
jgi:hypothetical protein